MTGWLRRWPRWSPYAASGWALALAAVAVWWALGGRAGFPLSDDGPAGAVAFGLAVLWSAAAGAAVATVRPFGRRLPRGVVLTAGWGGCVLAAAGTFGLVMNAMTLIFTGKVDDRASAAVNLLCAAGAALFAATMVSFQRRSGSVCARCGRTHTTPTATMATGTATGPDPHPAGVPRVVRWIAYLGAAAFVPYATMKTIWAMGGTFAGTSGAEMEANARHNGASELMVTMAKYGLDPTALAAAAGVVLLLALVYPWGQTFPRWVPALAQRRIPRWIPLTPAWLGAATLAPYGVAGAGYLILGATGVLSVNWGSDPYQPSESGRWIVAWFGTAGFGLFGTALGIAAYFYQRRTRPTCPPGTPGALAVPVRDAQRAGGGRA